MPKTWTPIAMTIEEGERLSMEISHSRHCGSEMHKAINGAISDAWAGSICNDVFLNSDDTLDELLTFWEIKHVRQGA